MSQPRYPFAPGVIQGTRQRRKGGWCLVAGVVVLALVGLALVGLALVVLALVVATFEVLL